MRINNMKKILITGLNSYIGNSVEKYLSNFEDEYHIEKISVRDEKWRELDFSNYNVVFNVAGIAHIRITPDMEKIFYRVNRDLSIALCEKAKKEGVNQYIYLSSMNVYGDTSDLITKDTIPTPKNFYGESKLQADIRIQEMNTNEFKVISVRPPVVYGPGCKGNYPKLSKLAKTCPVFPEYKNTRSMIYIENLCELIRLLIENNESGIFHPQNREYTSTFNLVEKIAQVHNRKILKISLFNSIIRLLLYRIRLINRVFADDRYSMEISDYNKFKYCIVNFKDSIEFTEMKNSNEPK
jgi:nucleoside-diphosphate-sugar epimerase